MLRTLKCIFNYVTISIVLKEIDTSSYTSIHNKRFRSVEIRRIFKTIHAIIIFV